MHPRLTYWNGLEPYLFLVAWFPSSPPIAFTFRILHLDMSRYNCTYVINVSKFELQDIQNLNTIKNRKFMPDNISKILTEKNHIQNKYDFKFLVHILYFSSETMTEELYHERMVYRKNSIARFLFQWCMKRSILGAGVP